MTRLSDWAIPGRVWAILFSWGVGILIFAGLLSYYVWKNEQDQEREEATIQFEQDSAMCALIEPFLEEPAPPPGPAGERGRVIQQRMRDYWNALHCQEVQADPRPARDRDHE